jgi:hypothetical protein
MNTNTEESTANSIETIQKTSRKKKTAMIFVGTLLGALLVGSAVLPIYSFIHVDREHTLIQYSSTVPAYWKFEGIQSFTSTRDGIGWINPRPLNHLYIYNPTYILDINSCLSRSVYNNYTEGYHYRLSLCRMSGDPSDIDIRIQLHFGNGHGDITTGGRYGVTLGYEEFLSIVKMAPWIQDWYFKEPAVKQARERLARKLNINITDSSSRRELVTDTKEYYEEVQNIFRGQRLPTFEQSHHAFGGEPFRRPPVNTRAFTAAVEESAAAATGNGTTTE